MKTDKDTQTWEIELLTPLHIGDGTELQYNLDYISNSKSIDVIEFDSLLESLSDYPSAINDLSKSIALERLMKDYKINIQPVYSLPFKGNSTPKSIRRFLKNGHGQPFMAGSSLKGAIHTALWATLDRSRLPASGNYREFSGAVKSLGGKDPYHMFIRPLQISDSIGIEPKGAMNCEEIKFFNLQRENKPGWKDFGTRQTKDRFQETTGLFVECLKPGIKLCLQSRLDPFLNSAPIKQVAKIIECTGLSEFHTLTQTINTHSLHLATRERTFFSEYRTETASVVNFYDNLIHQIESAGPDSETSFLRLSWGSGWRGMTGDWIDDFTLKEVRIQKRLGKQGVDVFPKTRRLAIDPEKGVPCLPLGWVRIKQVEKSRFSLTVGPVENNIADVILKPTAPVIPLPPPDPETEYQIKLAQFKTRVEKMKNFQGEVGALIPIINAQENERLKQAMCMVLRDKANDLPNKAYTKGLKDNKNWASSLKTLFEANGG
jgi:CRISPR/Cas system CSM-associated protein Csm5 (group 7 of RAMP superfamily)